MNVVGPKSFEISERTGALRSERLDDRSRMSRETHVRFWESARVRSPRATHLPFYRQHQRMGDCGITVTRPVAEANGSKGDLITRTHLRRATRIGRQQSRQSHG